jgi:hypothetical protein
MAYRPSVVDVPIVGLSQSEPEHGGPEGRATVLRDAQVTHYTPAEPGVTQKVRIEPREAFVSMPATLRGAATGAADAATTWNTPELLEALGDQLVAICGSTPRVFNGTNWSSYPATRVVTNQLSQDVLHTTNHVLQAPDCARIGNVTCFVWTETTPNPAGVQYQPMVAFRGDDGAWVRTPFSVWSNPPASPPTMVRVVSDGVRFFVFSTIGIAGKIGVWVYDTTGTQLGSDTATIPLTWSVSPGYWDVQGQPSVGVVSLIQPTSNTTTGANVGLTHWLLQWIGSISISTAVVGGVVAKCSGPCAFMDNTISANGRVYVATLGVAGALFAYELNRLTGQSLFEYSFGAVVNGSGIPDGLTGWAEPNGAGVIAHVAFSVLSNFAPPAGPPNDPGLRHTRSYACTRALAVSLTNQVNGVLLSSRAFQIDQDWYAAVYYQSGGGQARAGTTTPPTFDDATDYFIGSAVQPLPLNVTDIIVGSGIKVSPETVVLTDPRTKVILYRTQAIATITHNAGDSAVAATQTWTFLNAAFGFSTTFGSTTAYNSYLRVTGSVHAGNNADFRVIKVISATQVVTEIISTTGTTMVDDTLAGVTGTLVASVVFSVSKETLGDLFPPSGSIYYNSGTAQISGPTVSGASATIIRAVSSEVHPVWTGAVPMDSFLCTFVAGNAFAYIYPGNLLTITLTNANKWGLFSNFMLAQDVGNNLVVSGTPQNDGSYQITSIDNAFIGFISAAVTGSETGLVPQLLLPPLPTIQLVLADPSQAYHMHVAAAAFDDSYKGAYFTFTPGGAPPESGVWQVVQVLGPTDLILTPVDGRTGIRSLPLSIDVNVTITRVTNQPNASQPCWYLMPLSIAQHAAGRWDWGVAYADWRFDGETKANTGTFERNGFPLALASVVASSDGKQLTLPYRAQSFTAGQLQNGSQTQTGLTLTAQSTVGLKLFDIAAAPGLPVRGAGAMLLPGLQATQYSATGFPEDGINLGPETPFLVSQATSGATLVLTLNVTYQYGVAFEVTNENGDRVWSTISPMLEVTMRGTVNKNTIGGRMPGPTNRVVGVAIYRTSNVNGTPTIQHYKITNDLDTNGTGFTFYSRNGGADYDTWEFADTVPDPQILSSEVIYTDKSLLQRFPAPANRQGVSGWKARDWVVGYDGAVWMSGEKVEGDAVWWHPAFRYTAFGDDSPVSVCPMDDYLLVFCERTIWYIPADRFPDATGKNGTLPNPVQLPFQNGGTGFCLAIRPGAVYSSTAGGVWLITRDLQNLWLSEAVRDSLTTVAGMAVDGKQRLWVTSGTNSVFVYDQVTKAWWEWTLPGAGTARQVAIYRGQGSFFDSAGTSPVAYAPGVYLDNIDGVTEGIAPDITFASLEFGGVRAFKCMWACQIVGLYLGPHRLHAVMGYPDDDMPDTTYPPFVPTGVGPYIFEINPMVEETAAFDLRIFADFVGVPTPGASFALELLSFEVGLEPGLARIPSSRRIPG